MRLRLQPLQHPDRPAHDQGAMRGDPPGRPQLRGRHRERGQHAYSADIRVTRVMKYIIHRIKIGQYKQNKTMFYFAHQILFFMLLFCFLLNLISIVEKQKEILIRIFKWIGTTILNKENDIM